MASWWDYGYQTTAMANRTVIVDNNTWNNTHIATVRGGGRAVGHRLQRQVQQEQQERRLPEAAAAAAAAEGTTQRSSAALQRPCRAPRRPAPLTLPSPPLLSHQVGRAMASPEKKAWHIFRSLDVEYVFVVFGGFIG